MDNLINKTVEVRADKALNALTVKFLGFILLEEFIKTLEYEYALIRHYHLTQCMIDLRLIPVYPAGAPEHVKEKWFPTVGSLGIRRIAFVVPAATLGQASMNKAHKDTETIGGIVVKHFKDPETALAWLKTQ